MTQEQRKISDINQNKARQYFKISGDFNLVLHHIDPSWKENDIERYIQWNPDDLVVMTRSEHAKLHMTGKKFTEETCKRMSEAHKGAKYSEERCKMMSELVKGDKNPMYGKTFSEEHRKRMSEAQKGYHWYNNGVIQTKCRECPNGFVPGRILKG